MGTIQRIQTGIVYRGGSRTDTNCTPRAGIDTQVAPGKVPGLSTFLALEDAVQPGEKAQGIDLALLEPPLQGFLDEEGHVAITPVDASGNVDLPRLEEWAACRGTDQLHPFTQMVQAAVVQVNLRRPK